jgi:phosphoglycolate phosphatase-like HAD superfamily hydrolase
MNRAVILDVDGVLLDSYASAEQFTAEVYHCSFDYGKNPAENPFFQKFPEVARQLFAEFAASPYFTDMPALPGMTQLVHDLAQDYDLIIMTAIMLTDGVKEGRIRNLRKCFGEVFTEYIFTDQKLDDLNPASKGEHLRQVAARYEFTSFIDDTARHVLSGLGIVDRPIWLATKRRADEQALIAGTDVALARTAEDIRQLLL